MQLPRKAITPCLTMKNLDMAALYRAYAGQS
jgi:hypothetical protein